MCLTKECLEEYKEKLEKGIMEYMRMPASQKSAEAITSMYEALELVEANISDSSEMTDSDALNWVSHMKNTDGSRGGHWTMDQTTSVGVPEGISEEAWWITMNMIYSDYSNVAEMFGVNTAEFYSEMAKAFLYDEDSVDDKLSQYYHHIVRK